MTQSDYIWCAAIFLIACIHARHEAKGEILSPGAQGFSEALVAGFIMYAATKQFGWINGLGLYYALYTLKPDDFLAKQARKKAYESQEVKHRIRSKDY